MFGFDDKEPITKAQLKKYEKMKMSKFLEMMDKAHPEWKVKTTMLSKKKDYALQQAKANTSYLSISDFTDSRLGQGKKTGKNKGKINVGKVDASMTNYYIPDNKKSLDAYAKKKKEAKYKWLISRGNLKGLTTYDWVNWAGIYPKFQYGYGSGDSITSVGIKGWDKGTLYDLKVALIKAHHGLQPLNEKGKGLYYNRPVKYTHRQTLNAWGLKKVKSIPQEKAPSKKEVSKKKTTTKKAKSPTKKKAVKKVARKKTATKKKTTTRKRKAPAKKKTATKKKTTRKKK